MKPYLCYIHRPERSLADFTVITADGDDRIDASLDAVAAEYPTYLRLEVFDGERRVTVREPTAG